MPDPVLRLAEAERHRAEIALDAHYDTCDVWPQVDCPECCYYAMRAAHAARTVWRLEAEQDRAEDERAARWRRGKCPAPVITGLRVDPRRQP